MERYDDNNDINNQLFEIKGNECNGDESQQVDMDTRKGSFSTENCDINTLKRKGSI
jgi:hypothetical protein